MIHVASKRIVVVDPLAANANILKAIPHSKPLLHNGQAWVAVPHGVEEHRVLRNLGYENVPSPILHYYRWPGRFKPRAHQQATADFLTQYPLAACLSDPGTGKTAATLWASDFLLDQAVIDTVLVVTPLSTVKEVWGKEITTILPHRRFELLVGTKEKRLSLLNSKRGAKYFVVNHDGFGVIADALPTKRILVIYDEATALKNPGTTRFRVFWKWTTTGTPMLWFLTGTPIAQSPLNAWPIAKLMKNPHVERTYVGFRDRVMNKVSQFRWIPKADALQVCQRVLQPSIRYALDDCADIPDLVYEDRQTQLTQPQVLAFKEMQTKAAALISGNAITAANAAVVLNKLVQVCCGVVYDNVGNSVMVDVSPRLASLVDLISEVENKIIVFVPLRSVQDMLVDHIRKAGYTVESVHGDVAGSTRDTIFNDFQNKPDPMVLVAHPAVASHGLTLTAASTVVWYAPIYSLERYEQANARIHRIGAKHKCRVVHLYACGFERELYRRLSTKKKVLDDFLELVNGENDGL